MLVPTHYITTLPLNRIEGVFGQRQRVEPKDAIGQPRILLGIPSQITGYGASFLSVSSWLEIHLNSVIYAETEILSWSANVWAMRKQNACAQKIARVFTKSQRNALRTKWPAKGEVIITRL